MNYQIRKSEAKDMVFVLELIKELAFYEKEANEVAISEVDLIRDGFSNPPLFSCFVAEVESTIRGAAIFYNRYSTWKGKTVHLEDLIVQEAYRGKGIGKALYSAVMEEAWSQGVKRVEWNVLDWNEPAIKFYESTGAKVLRDWDTAQMSFDSLKSFLNK
ncbi:GNAT family N-acetyltransferase [Flavobacteriaceae bacterium]|nr:GNAT family N-acetyltransferase [Flavobacteriaceae bacterium]